MKKVLIIDDDIFLTELYARLLEREGMRVDVANSGAEALARISDSHPDLMVLDLHMPGMHGKEVLQAIRNDSAFNHIPVIVFSTGYEKTLMAEVGDLGVHKVFSKMKCKPRALVAEIKESLAHHKPAAAAPPAETVSVLEAGVQHMDDAGTDHLPLWIERLRTDSRNEARQVCLLHLYQIMRDDILFAMKQDASSAEGKLGQALRKLLEDLYENPGLIRETTVESLNQALHKLLALNEQSRNVRLDSETMLQDVLNGL